MGRPPIAIEERFWSKVAIAGEDDCWFWMAASKRGYGLVRHEGRQQMAHRVSYKISKGEIPEDLVVRHKCDNPSCVNPTHLELGTHKQNNADMYERGRNVNPRGESSSVSTLKTADVIEIRRLYASCSATEIEKTTGYTIGEIKSALRHWRHLDDAHPVASKSGERTECPKGHPYDSSNTYVRPSDGAKFCRICKRNHTAESKRRQRTH